MVSLGTSAPSSLMAMFVFLIVMQSRLNILLVAVGV